MKITDDRTDEQKKTHFVLVVGTHEFAPSGGKKYFALACEEQDYENVRDYMKDRVDILTSSVRTVNEGGHDGKPYRPIGVGTCHIEVVTSYHLALDEYHISHRKSRAKKPKAGERTTKHKCEVCNKSLNDGSGRHNLCDVCLDSNLKE